MTSDPDTLASGLALFASMASGLALCVLLVPATFVAVHLGQRLLGHTQHRVELALRTLSGPRL